ncbi:tRNA (N6-threonylcarbamoyladenosine(37)-N6)-methyltransferase TrmO [Neisseria sp. Ec49-e6-T10]|uniref:tRNA (N6-threonylcarbamoyladenosine(37)-N6)-methyltransferase TrmO n=1 Tax=Neisseria sp. Ec49-e6-T10 TaxID=3140744 RepID=UPI003EBDE8DE
MQIFECTPIGFIHSPYQQKFGIPRQPHLAPAAKVTLELIAPYNHPDCVRGLEEFEYVWVQFIFHQCQTEGWAPLVRPPRLGGSKKKGVFATRSPHRPNHIGLSLLKLEEIQTKQGVRLIFSGADLLDKTPVLDIKPYLPFVEAIAQAKSGFVDQPPPILPVLWSEKALAVWQNLNKEQGFRLLIEQSLAQDPRPAFHQDDKRQYGMLLENINVIFQVTSDCVTIVDLLLVPTK